MTDTAATFFDEVQGEVPRDRAGHPLLVPKGVSVDAGVRVPYTRASSLADYISDSSYLHTWEMRYLAKAMGKHEDLAALAAAETYSTGLSNVPEQGEKRRSGRRLDSIIERALDRERIHEKADYGTSVHAFTEPGAPTSVPERMKEDVASFQEVIRQMSAEIVATESFTANDRTMSAGTFDHLMRIPHPRVGNDLVITDKKTGSVSEHEWAIQLATYAYGDPYDVDTDTRPPWPGKINLEWAVVFRIPALEGRTEVYWLNIARGWEAALTAAAARDYQADRTLLEPFKPSTFVEKLELADTKEALRRLWHSTTNVVEQAVAAEKAGGIL